MFSLETVFCPCCTGVLLATLAQTRTELQYLVLGTSSLAAAVGLTEQRTKVKDVSSHHRSNSQHQRDR
jgi:hypothetical protein